MLRLVCNAQEYAWGKFGSSSTVAQFASAQSSKFEISETKPYAELWMGTHPNAPSKLFETGEDLGAFLKSKPSLMNEECFKVYGDLPFLFKVLSVNIALSIQAHPNKTLAKELFEKYPNIYKDPNHKPEMAIALTPFEALCGFRPLNEIKQFLIDYPEFRNVVGHSVAHEFISNFEKDGKQSLKNLFSSLMKADDGVVKKELEALITRISNLSTEKQTLIDHLIQRLNTQFPHDVGCFCVFVLNFLTLQPGESIFLNANLPHAYLSGDCVECMATSDNVVRAGLTPKLRDVETLISMLDYDSSEPKELLLHTQKYGNGDSTTLYRSPVPEFSMLQTNLKPNQTENFEGINGPSILIITQGKGQIQCGNNSLDLQKGFVFYIPSNTKIDLTSGEEGLLCYRSFCDRFN